MAAGRQHHKDDGQSQLQGGSRRPAREQPRVPSDAHRSGELTFTSEPHPRPSGGGLGLATFLLGDVTSFGRYVSTNTDAREQQWRHGLLRAGHLACHAKLTLNYGLRLDIINPQTVNEPGNGGFLDLATGEIRVAGVGGIGLNGDIENKLNWAPRVGVTYQVDSKTVLRAGYGRSYDLGVFGSLFGHSVTQNLPVLSVQELNAPENFDRVFTLAQGPPPPVFPAVPSNGRFPLPNGVFARALPGAAAAAHRGCVQRDRAASADRHACRSRPGTSATAAETFSPATARPSTSTSPHSTATRACLKTFAGRFSPAASPTTSDSAARSAGRRGSTISATARTTPTTRCRPKFNKRFSNGYSVKANYTLQRQVQESGDYFIYDVELNKGPADWDRTHNFIFSLVAELPIGRGRRYLTDVSPLTDAFIGGWQFNTNTIIQSGLPFNVSYRDAGADRDTGAQPAESDRRPGGSADA